MGATTSTFPYTPSMRAYLTATGRAPVSRAADEAASRGFLAADEGAEYDQLIEIVRICNFRTRSRIEIASYSELVGIRAQHQWPFHSRSGHSFIQVRLICERTGMEG